LALVELVRLQMVRPQVVLILFFQPLLQLAVVGQEKRKALALILTVFRVVQVVVVLLVLIQAKMVLAVQVILLQLLRRKETLVVIPQ
jgi:hypothetical protein